MHSIYYDIEKESVGTNNYSSRHLTVEQGIEAGLNSNGLDSTLCL